MVNLADIRKRARARKDEEKKSEPQTAEPAKGEPSKKGSGPEESPVAASPDSLGTPAPSVSDPVPTSSRRKHAAGLPENLPSKGEAEIPEDEPPIWELAATSASPAGEPDEIVIPARADPSPAINTRRQPDIPAEAPSPSRPPIAVTSEPVAAPPRSPLPAELEAVAPVLEPELEDSGVPIEGGNAHEEILSEFLTFSLGEEEYAMPIDRIVEIVPHRSTTPVPNADETVVGILSLRGVVVTILDVRSRLGGKYTPVTLETRFVVVGLEKEMVGLQVDRVRRVVRFSKSDVEPPPRIGSGEGSDCVAGVVERGGRIVIVLDLDRLLGVAPVEAIA